MIEGANQVIDFCDSTNDLARVLGEKGSPHGTWISARKQGAGRGRLGRKWESLEGNLLLSMIARIESKSVWTWVPMAAALGAARAVREMDSRIDLRIKWPNDLWIGGRKTGGILCEAVGNSSGSFIIIGLGLNCAHAPEGLDQETTSLSLASGRAIIADDVRMKVIEGVLRSLEILVGPNGTALIAEEYARLAALAPGTRITWTTSQNGEQTGQVLGLGSIGELLVGGANGETLRLYAEDVKVRPF